MNAEIDLKVESTYEEIAKKTKSMYSEVFGLSNSSDDDNDNFSECVDFQPLCSFEISPCSNPKFVKVESTSVEETQSFSMDLEEAVKSILVEETKVVILDSGKLRFIYNDDDCSDLLTYGLTLIPAIEILSTPSNVTMTNPTTLPPLYQTISVPLFSTHSLNLPSCDLFSNRQTFPFSILAITKS